MTISVKVLLGIFSLFQWQAVDTTQACIVKDRTLRFIFQDALEVMINVPKKANDAMHLSMLEGLEDSIEALGEVILQDNFTVWDPKQLIKKGRERHIFLFDMCLIFAKESKDSNGKTKYMSKFKLMVCIKQDITTNLRLFQTERVCGQLF